MPLFLQSLPLSFRTLWRYMILLPFLAVFSLILGIFTQLPLVGWAVSGVILAFCTMTGLRCALAARGHYTRPDFSAMLKASLFFSILGFFSSLVLFLVGWALAMATGWLGVVLSGLSPTFEGQLLITLILQIAMGALLAGAYAAFLAVPMTAMAASIGRRGADGMGFVDGFGEGFFSLMLITFVWVYVGQFWAIFGEMWLAFAFVVKLLVAVLTQTRLDLELNFAPGTVLGGGLLMTWASSWFYATAVLAWERAAQRRAVAWETLAQEKRATSDDLRALREAREQGARSAMG